MSYGTVPRIVWFELSLMPSISIPALRALDKDSGLIELAECSDGRFRVGYGGVRAIRATGDRKVEFIAFEDHTLAYVNSAMGYPAYYPVHPIAIHKPIQAVLMDLDGTSIRSERFWIWIIEKTTASLLNDPAFRLAAADFPWVSGHSVSEHLQYCINKYCPRASLERARQLYTEHMRRELDEIQQGRGQEDVFAPAPGLKEFLLELKAQGVKIGLVTSGLYEKAWPAIVSGFRAMSMGDPRKFYDAIITGGFPLHKDQVGTLGELSAKPHPWLYAELSRVGLGIPFENRNSVVGIEDSGAGVCAIRLAGFPTIGIGGGNIESSGTRALCTYYCETFEQILAIIR